jgi:WD40 repeat protein
LAFSPDSKRLASHSGDHTVKLWDPATGQELANLVGHQREVYTVAFHPDGSRIATTGPDGFVKIWNTQTGVELLNLRNDPERSTGTALVFTPDGNRLASGHWNGLVRIADARVRGETQRVVAADRKIVGVALSQGKPELVAKLDSGDFAAWNLETGQPVENKVLPIDVKEFVNSDQRWYAMLDGGGARLTKIHDGYDPWSEDEATREQWSAAWHTKHLGWTESAREWFGTTFHLKRLIALKPTRQAVGDARFATDEELHADYAARLKYAEEQWAMFRNAVLPPDVPR